MNYLLTDFCEGFMYKYVRHELEEVEKHVCPNLSSSRNAFQAVVEILARRKVASRVRPGVGDVGGWSLNYLSTILGCKKSNDLRIGTWMASHIALKANARVPAHLKHTYKVNFSLVAGLKPSTFQTRSRISKLPWWIIGYSP